MLTLTQASLKKRRLKGLVSIISLLVLFPVSTSANTITETRYYRNDQRTVNGKTAYQLGNSNTGFLALYGGERMRSVNTITYGSFVYIRHDDGTDTMIGQGIALTMRNRVEGEGYQTATWNCPDTPLRPTDAVLILDYIWNVSTQSRMAERYFITEPLGASKLNAATWTFTRWTLMQTYIDTTCFGVFHGSSDYTTRIEGFSYTFIPPPTVNTQNVDGISYTQSNFHGTVTNNGGATVVERGFDWGLTANYGNSWTASGTFGTEVFSYTISTLTPGTTYHFRAKARNSAGWGYGGDIAFTTTPYIDIGLRAYDGSQIIHIACEPAGILTSPLRIRKGLITYGIVLVDPSDAKASKIRIRTKSAVKALRKY